MRQCFWHPGTQMKDFEGNAPMSVQKARGIYIEDVNGRQVIDAISSWWCKSLGHGHPRLKAAFMKQCDQFEHVIQASTTNKIIAELSELLTSFHDPLTKVFYAGDGSSAVEIALKMSLHSHRNRGQSERTQFISLKNGYHGETCGSLSVSDLGRYKESYQSMLFECETIGHLPYVTDHTDPLWADCSPYWEPIKNRLEQIANSLTAVILEPIAQGAAGMMIYSQDFLKRLRDWTDVHHIHLIADEIMTGMGRTGQLFACDHAGVVPDFMCLSKGLTSGWLPFSAVLTTDEVYDSFYGRERSEDSFLHSHTYSGHVLGAAVALEAVTIIKEMIHGEDFRDRCQYLQNAFQDIVESLGILVDVRSIGMICAVDIRDDFYSAEKMRTFTRVALEEGVLLRPIGRTIYWLPPLTIDFAEIDQLKKCTLSAFQRAFFNSL